MRSANATFAATRVWLVVPALRETFARPGFPASVERARVVVRDKRVAVASADFATIRSNAIPMASAGLAVPQDNLVALTIPARRETPATMELAKSAAAQANLAARTLRAAAIWFVTPNREAHQRVPRPAWLDATTVSLQPPAVRASSPNTTAYNGRLVRARAKVGTPEWCLMVSISRNWGKTAAPEEKRVACRRQTATAPEHANMIQISRPRTFSSMAQRSADSWDKAIVGYRRLDAGARLRPPD